MLGDMRCDAQPAHLGDEVLCVEQFVAAYCDAAARRKIAQHACGRLPLRRAGRLGQARIHQAIAVLHQ